MACFKKRGKAPDKPLLVCSKVYFTTEKARFLVLTFMASVGVTIFNIIDCEEQMERVDVYGERSSNKYQGPQQLRAL